MGYTRARRYTTHKGGRKYTADKKEILPWQYDPLKAESAEIFREKWRLAGTDEEYLRKRKEHRERYEKASKVS